ncbi:hypothetical protein HYV43_00495 [Candidatus Micrarchaeota archaeon]|nr:hypothetical protein [Candidatus Micrarchaeota archaeon]
MGFALVRVNFTCFPEKVRTGSKRQTIRPPRDDVHVGDSLQIWWNRRGLPAGRYCEPCALVCVFEPASAAHFLKCHGGEQKHYVKLPQKLNEGVVTEKFKIEMGATALTGKRPDLALFWIRKDGRVLDPRAARHLIREDGFADSKSFFAFFQRHYGIREKPANFEVIRWVS